MIDHRSLTAVLVYEPETGVFRWHGKDKPRCVSRGVVAGTTDTHGYVVIRIGGERYKAHRLAWFYEHGCWPSHQIDHINGLRSDNRLANLREATGSQNSQNQRKANKDSRSGMLGASWNAAARKWQAQIGVSGKTRFLGIFESPHEAHSAYMAAKRLVHPFSVHGGK